jgi:hypothetical protein
MRAIISSAASISALEPLNLPRLAWHTMLLRRKLERTPLAQCSGFPCCLVLLGTSLAGSALPVAAAPCPPAAAAVIDRLYRWVAAWERANASHDPASQAQRFTLALPVSSVGP